jgi:undecaprenyl-diphosphatase
VGKVRGRWWTLPWLHLNRLERRELNWLFVGLGACVLLFVFINLAGEVMEGDTLAFDTKFLRALRSPADPSKPVGPPWLENAFLDLTAIGGPTVLGLVVFAVVGFLLLQARYRTALFVLLTSASGELLNFGMKQLFNRPRPTIVPHLRDVVSTSFPSGHAMESAIVYLTLGAILMRVAESRLTKIYIISVATLLTMLAGISRVYLGVHYPTDVIGGWIVGFMWALVCWLVSQRFEAIEEEKAKAPGGHAAQSKRNQSKK